MQNSSSSTTPNVIDELKTENNTGNANKVATVEGVYYDFENMEKFFAGEGRTITIETDKFFVVACYVPNSGM